MTHPKPGTNLQVDKEKKNYYIDLEKFGIEIYPIALPIMCFLLSHNWPSAYSGRSSPKLLSPGKKWDYRENMNAEKGEGKVQKRNR